MSRKWERMVEKNRKNVNAQRKRHGQTVIKEAGEDASVTVKGRSWILPSSLFAFALFYFIYLGQHYPHDWKFWFTGLCYVGLGLIVLLIQRPFIRIGSRNITVRRFTGYRSVEAENIEFITVSPKLVEIKWKKGGVIYTKFQHRFPMDELGARLKEFAGRNKVQLTEK